MVDNKTSFLIKDIDRNYWRKVKITALKKDMTLKDFILLCIDTEIQKKKKGDS